VQGAVAESAARNKVATKSFLKPGRIDTVSPCGETIYNFVASRKPQVRHSTPRAACSLESHFGPPENQRF
jgi:hypothetical protein